MHLVKKLRSENKNYYFPILIAFLFLVYFPEVYTWLTPPEGFVFNGGFLNITDFNVYLSAIRQGAEGAWVFEPQFTPESFPPYFAFVPYILAGKIMSLVGGGVLLWFHALKLISLIWALNNLISLSEAAFPDRSRLQKTSFLLFLFSNGIGWLVLPFIGELTPITPDLFVPEWNLLNGAFASPHFMLGIAFQAAFFRAILGFFAAPGWKTSLPVVLAGVGLSLTYPYLTVVDGLVLATYLIFQAIRSKHVHWEQILQLGTACIPMILALAYYGLLLPRDPLYQMLIVANNQIQPPPITGLLVGFGLLLPLAAFGLRCLWQKQHQQIIIFWMAINLIAIYLPFSFSGRFISGLNIPLILLAAAGIEDVLLPWIKSRIEKKSSFFRNVIILLTSPSTLMFIVYFTMIINSYDIFPFYHMSTELEAAAWLAEITTDEDILLAEFPMCNLLPRYGKGRVFNGHFDLTVDMEGKSDLVETFWQNETSEQWRQAFINDWGFTYIYQGPYENSHNSEEPLILPYEIIYQTESDLIYRVP